MKRIILVVLMLGFCKVVSADIYVVYHKTSKEIMFIAEGKNYVINDPDLRVKVLPNDLDFYALDKPHSDYKLSGNDIVINTSKISDREDAKNAKEALEVQRLIDRGLAKTKLMAIGLSGSEFEAIAR